MKDLWITTEKLAKIKGVSPRAIRKAIKANKYCIRKVGRSYEILVSTLDEETQSIIQNDSSISENKSQIKITRRKKEIALAKFELIMEWRKFIKKGKGGKVKSTKEFVTLYNKELICPLTFDILGSVSRCTIFRWDKRLKENNDDWYALVNVYVPCNKEIGLSKIEKETFLSLLLHQNNTNIGKAIKLTKHVLSSRGITKFCCDMTYRRFAKKYKSEHYDIWVFARQGAKALKDNVTPYIEKDLSDIEVGEILVGDGHRLAFQVINPFTGKPCRPMLAAYQDWKSGALVGFEIMLEENTQCIASALRNSILNLGKIPQYVYQDNGKAFKSKYFIENNGITGLFVKLGITPIFARPYNAKAKVIERFFREMQDSFERLLPSFVGSNIDNKPAYMKRNEKFHKAIHNPYIPTIEEVIKFLHSWLEFHYAQECPNVKGKSIGEVLLAGKGKGIDVARLDDLMLATEIKNIGRNGIRFLKSDYFDESLYGLRTKVVIKYSLFDLSSIKVFSTDGTFLCVAKRMEPLNPLAYYTGNAKDINDLKERLKQQKQLEQQTVKAYISELKHEKAYLPMFKEENYDEYKSLEDKKVIAQTLKDVDEIDTVPVFQNQYERYEFLTNKEQLSKAEQDWINNYINSEEYNLIYGIGENDEESIC